MMFAKHNGAPTRLQRIPVAGQDGITGTFRIRAKMVRFDGQPRARGQPDQVHGIGHDGHFIEIIDAPHQTPLTVAPRPEILHMQIAHRQNRRGPDNLGTNLRPELTPPVKGPPQKRKHRPPHQRMLQPQISCDQGDLTSQPAFISACRFVNVQRLSPPA